MINVKFFTKILFFCLITNCTNSQNSNNKAIEQEKEYNLNFTTETIVVKKNIDYESYGTPKGYIHHNIIYPQSDGSIFSLSFLDEKKFVFSPIYWGTTLAEVRRLFSFNYCDSLIFYSEAFNNEGESLNMGYRRLILRDASDREILLDSIYDVDKMIHSNFSTDSKYLIINTLSELPEHYNPIQDDQFIVYDVDSLRNGRIVRSVILCRHCANGHLVNDQLFFTRSDEPDDLWGGFAWKDIYVAPWGNLKDSTKIASRSEIMSISPDGKYILAKRSDFPNGVCAIINVETKKYQLLLGRDYNNLTAFYSYEKEKFAFDFGKYIIYVDFPEEYPFDAFNTHNSIIPFSEGRKIKEQFKHKPLE